MAKSDICAEAKGRWLGILAHIGIERGFLTGKPCACPICGGKDRFRFDDKEGRGTWFCSHCRAGDGISLAMRFTGKSFKETADQIRSIVGTISTTQPRIESGEADKLAACKRIWSDSRHVTSGDPVHRYLSCRIPGLNSISSAIRFHPSLPYRHDDGSVSRHPAMVSKVQGVDGSGVAIHRTYITSDGKKADLPVIKKVIGKLPESSAVRLSAQVGCLGLAEGIETALAASELFKMPVWSCISANGLETFTPPDGVEKVTVFADNDASFAGQKAAFNAAYRLHQKGFIVQVETPNQRGDWLDILVAR